ncbi:MAG: hypothetical protein J6K53_02685 [Roseburia sp.]|nr:hypothetical protein [Roseburia sp.]
MENFLNNEAYENDAEMAAGVEESTTNIVNIEEKKQMRPAFAFWKIGDEEVKLKLTTPQTLELEKKFRKNLITLMGDENNIPPLTTMLQIIHAAAVPWNHGIRLKNVMDLYEKYMEAGGTQMNLYVDVYLQIYMVSGFFSPTVAEEMSDTMKKIQEDM